MIYAHKEPLLSPIFMEILIEKENIALESEPFDDFSGFDLEITLTLAL